MKRNPSLLSMWWKKHARRDEFSTDLLHYASHVKVLISVIFHCFENPKPEKYGLRLNRYTLISVKCGVLKLLEKLTSCLVLS